MQEASIQGLWFIAILILGYYAFKWLARIFLPIMMQKAVRNFEKKAREQAREKKEMALAREKYIKSLAGREESIWEEVDTLIDSKQPAKYDEAVELLVDLRDLNKKTGTEKAFKQKLKTICENHHRKVSFLNRLQKAGLSGDD